METEIYLQRTKAQVVWQSDVWGMAALDCMQYVVNSQVTALSCGFGWCAYAASILGEESVCLNLHTWAGAWVCAVRGCKASCGAGMSDPLPSHPPCLFDTFTTACWGELDLSSVILTRISAGKHWAPLTPTAACLLATEKPANYWMLHEPFCFVLFCSVFFCFWPFPLSSEWGSVRPKYTQCLAIL